MELTLLESSFKFAGPVGTSSLLPALLGGGASWQDMQGNYDGERRLGRKTRHLSSATLFFGSTAALVLENPELKQLAAQRPDRIGVYVSEETINLEDDFSFDLSAKVHGPDYVSPLQAPNTLANVVGSHFASFTGVTGPNCTISAGQSSGFQALQVAALGLAEHAVDCAVVGGVEVCSDYHRLAYAAPREVAIAYGIAPARPADRLVFFPPKIRLPHASGEAELAGRLKSELANLQGIDRLDAVVLAFSPASLNPDRLHSELSQHQASETLLLGERVYGRGESCSALLALGVGAELLKAEQVDWDALGDRVLGQRGVPLHRLALIGLDEQGQFSILIMEKRL